MQMDCHFRSTTYPYYFDLRALSNKPRTTLPIRILLNDCKTFTFGPIFVNKRSSVVHLLEVKLDKKDNRKRFYQAFSNFCKCH